MWYHRTHVLQIVVLAAGACVLLGTAEDGGCSLGVNPAQQLCTSTGGAWGTWGEEPATCEGPGQPVETGSTCRCGGDKLFWSDGIGCVGSSACPASSLASNGCPNGYEKVQNRCCRANPGEKTVWCEHFDTRDETFWETAPGFAPSWSVQNGVLVVERSAPGAGGLKTRQAYGYGFYRCRFRVASGSLEPATGWGIWQWQPTGSAPTGTFNELDTVEIYGDSWDSALPEGGSTGSDYLSNIWIRCPMVPNPPSSCKRGESISLAQPINDGNWHEFRYTYLQSFYDLAIDGRTVRTIRDTNLPVPPMAIYAAVNIRSASRALRLEIDDCSYAVKP